MINVSDNFKAAVYSSVRKVNGKVTFDISDVTASEDTTPEVTSEEIISRTEQMIDHKLDRPALATFEPNYWKLDGSFAIPPKHDQGEYEVGWYSSELSDEDAEFNTPQIVEFNFTETHSSMGLTITFDTPANEYASDFKIQAFRGATEILSIVEIANEQARYIIEDQFDNYDRIVITLYKWSHPKRRAKIIEVSFGVVREYTDDNLISVNLLEEISTTASNLPANELRFTVDNQSKEFNILNPTGVYKFLQERQTANFSLGVEISPDIYEWVSTGTYYLSDWQSDDGALTATFTARNLIDFLPDDEIESLTGSASTLGSMVESYLIDGNVKNYSIASELYSIPTLAIFKKSKLRNLLQMVAIAGRCVVYVDRSDKLIIKQLDDTSAIDYIDFDNIYSEPKIKLDKLISKVDVNYYSAADAVAGVASTSSDIKNGSTIKVENTLINSSYQAQEVANWIMREYNKRALYDLNWRQNPALECGDTVRIEDTFGADKTSVITKQEFEYAGYLSGRTNTKGAI